MLWSVLVQRLLRKHFTLDCEPKNTIALDAASIPADFTFRSWCRRDRLNSWHCRRFMCGSFVWRFQTTPT